MTAAVVFRLSTGDEGHRSIRLVGSTVSQFSKDKTCHFYSSLRDKKSGRLIPRFCPKPQRPLSFGNSPSTPPKKFRQAFY